MNKVIPFSKHRERAQRQREQAVAWIARLDAGAQEQDLQDLRNWLAQDPEHLRLLMEYARLWDRMSLLEELSTIFSRAEFAEGAATHASQRRWLPLAMAATLLLAIGLWWFGSDTGQEGATETFRRSYDTLAGQQLKIDLEDGSSIVLNTRSHLDVEYDASARRIRLEDGEGLFQVAHDEKRPFQVYAGDRVIEAVGTAFSVYRRADGRVDVLVSEGTVLVYELAGMTPVNTTAANNARGNLRLPLRAGQFVSLSESDTAARATDISRDEVQARLFWQHGMLLFENDRLEDILGQVARYTTLEFVVAEELQDLRVGGYFRVDDVDGLLSDIESNFAIDIARGEGRVQLLPRSND